MGGSVTVHVAARKEIRNLHGLVVVDVVEVSKEFFSLCSSLHNACTTLISDCGHFCKQGTAMASLVHMQKILANRAQHFHSIEKAVCLI
jgi:protein phosphatase methylesterase 1